MPILQPRYLLPDRRNHPALSVPLRASEPRYLGHYRKLHKARVSLFPAFDATHATFPFPTP